MNNDEKLLIERYNQILLEAKFCGKCGAPLASPTSKFCGKCGAPVKQTPQTDTDQRINQTMSNVRQAVNNVAQNQQQQGQQAQQQIDNSLTNFRQQVQGMKDEHNKQRQAADQRHQNAVQQRQQTQQTQQTPQVENPYNQLLAMGQEAKNKIIEINKQVQAGTISAEEGRKQELKVYDDYKKASDQIHGGMFAKK